VRIAEYEGTIAELEPKVGQLTTRLTSQKRDIWDDRRRNLTSSTCERPAFSVVGGCQTMKLACSDYRRRPLREKWYESAN
jgi:hypothetical protein